MPPVTHIAKGSAYLFPSFPPYSLSESATLESFFFPFFVPSLAP